MSEQKSANRETCEKMFSSMLDQDWNSFQACLADDVFYRIGSGEEIKGKENVTKTLQGLYSQVEMQTPDIRQVIDLPESDQVIFEFEAHYKYLEDGSILNFACTDVLRMKDNKVNEWRVYVDMKPYYDKQK
ncbi:nuclear transport factor 2 family protein [Cyanobacterium stanieri LEGE 03274]|uniref:Nuclear transport factor 2 family protein n=1 Tax=Cyanobacterium stanieri LEGE 03274 TaxID=1828756 RepID=A0ABR9V381_9CHRO|nr:nuclear transport factor 2 family protein [Cyanobacterium stanieri]MBE9222358.1 nuclear transport factor 2 family protein [Cyanobacterium stanieri LEGE 03274]